MRADDLDLAGELNAADAIVMGDGNDDLVPFQPDWTLSPGVLLREELRARGITPGELAALAGLPEDTVRGVLAADARVDVVVADGLAATLGIRAVVWLHAERIYREALARGAADCSDEYREGDGQ